MKHPLRGWSLLKDLLNKQTNIFNQSKLGKRFWIVIFFLALIFIVEKSLRFYKWSCEKVIKIRSLIKARKNQSNYNLEKEVWI